MQKSPLPEPSLAGRHYKSQDGDLVAVCHPYDQAADRRLADALGVEAVVGAVEQKVTTMSTTSFTNMLRDNDFTFEVSRPLVTYKDPPPAWAEKTLKLPGIDDVPYMRGLPLTLKNCKALEYTPGPRLGSLDAVKLKPPEKSEAGPFWKPVPEAWRQGLIGSSSQATSFKASPFVGLTVVEYSRSSSAAVSGACALYCELGATVVRVKTDQALDLERIGGKVFSQQLHARKVTVALQEMLDSYLQSAHILVTDVSEEQRNSEIVSPPPGCSVLYFDPMKGALGSWYMPLGIVEVFRGMGSDRRGTSTKQLPFQVIDLLVSYQVAAVMGTLLFKQKRNGPNLPQTAFMDMERSGLYMSSFYLSFVQAAPAMLKFIDSKSPYTTSECRDLLPLPSTCNLPLKDGKYVFISGVNMGKDLPQLLTALNLKSEVTKKVIGVILATLCTCTCLCKDKMMVIGGIMKPINRAIKQKLATMTSEEFEKAMSRGKVDFWVYERGVDTLADMEQLHELGLLRPSEAGTQVRSPIRLMQGMTALMQTRFSPDEKQKPIERTASDSPMKRSLSQSWPVRRLLLGTV